MFDDELDCPVISDQGMYIRNSRIVLLKLEPMLGQFFL